jgi:hypothetical protein
MVVSVPAASAAIQRTAAQVLQTFEADQPKPSSKASDYFSRPTSEVAQKMQLARQQGLLLPSQSDSTYAKCLDDIVNYRNNTVVDLASLDADVKRCLRMYKMYAMEPCITCLQQERELFIQYQELKRDR